MRSELANAWGDFLSPFPWDWFLTLTFAVPVRSFRARHMFERFAADIEKAAGQRIGWFRADEYGPEGGRLHIHALMLNTRDLFRMHWLQEWNQRAGWARILPFEPGKGAAFYCAKYVTKELGDWDLSSNLATASQSKEPSQMLLCAPPSRTALLKPTPTNLLGFTTWPMNRNTAEDSFVRDLDRRHDGQVSNRDGQRVSVQGRHRKSPTPSSTSRRPPLRAPLQPTIAQQDGQRLLGKTDLAE